MLRFSGSRRGVSRGWGLGGGVLGVPDESPRGSPGGSWWSGGVPEPYETVNDEKRITFLKQQKSTQRHIEEKLTFWWNKTTYDEHFDFEWKSRRFRKKLISCENRCFLKSCFSAERWSLGLDEASYLPGALEGGGAWEGSQGSPRGVSRGCPWWAQ